MQTAREPVDRRSARARAMLQQALLSLIREKRYETISVKDICAAANVGRSTFYAHFTGKDDLKRSGLESLRRALGERHPFTLALFRHAREHAHLYRALKGTSGGDVAMGSIREMLSARVREELAGARGDGGQAIPADLVAQYVVGACMSMLTWWLDREADLPPEEVDAMARGLLTRGHRVLGAALTFR